MKKQPLKILKMNPKWLIAGIIFLILGYLILSWNSGGLVHFESKSNWQNLILAPIFLFSGYILVGVSIFKIKE